MPRMVITRDIAAPVDVVFGTVAQVEAFAKSQPQIVRVEFLTDQKVGVGTKFRETRLMRGKEATTELEVIEFVENEHTRIVADSHGAIWDTLFAVTPNGDMTTLTMTMDSKPYKFMQRLLLPLFNGMIRKEVAKDMDRVKAYCESKTTGTPTP